MQYYREKAGLTQMELAERIGVSQAYISKLENGDINGLTFRNFKKLCRVLHVCPYKMLASFFNSRGVITVWCHHRRRYNCPEVFDVNEKTTVYLEPKIKEEARIRLIKDGENKSLSALLNELLLKWLSEGK